MPFFIRVNMPIANSFLRKVLKVFMLLLAVVFVNAKWERGERRGNELKQHCCNFNNPEVLNMVYHSIFLILLTLGVCYWLVIYFDRYVLGNRVYIINFVAQWNRRPAHHQGARVPVQDAQQEPPNPSPPTRKCLILFALCLDIFFFLSLTS